MQGLARWIIYVKHRCSISISHTLAATFHSAFSSIIDLCTECKMFYTR